MRTCLAVVPVALVLLAGLPGELLACSRIAHPTVRDADASVFFGIATERVVHAGPGNVTFYPDREGLEPLDEPPRPVRGQLLRLERVEGRLAAAVRAAADRFGGEVVVVPWDYRADCPRIVWRGDMPWVEAGERGVYRGTLRDPEHWVDGRPTFDVHAWVNPYPQGRGIRTPGVRGRLTDLPANSLLTPDQYLDVYTALPTREEVEADPEAAVQRFREWVAARPETAERIPLPQILGSVERFAERVRVGQIELPVFGTYRARITPREGEARELYFRTSSTPRSAPDGYRLTVHVAAAEDWISRDHPRQMGLTCRVGNVVVAPEGEPRADGAVVWPARLRLMLELCFADDPEVMSALEDAEAINGDPLSGRFVLGPDGAARFEQAVEADGRTVLRVEAERVSEAVVRQRP